MKLSELVKDLDIIEMAADGETEISGISYDSRAARPGDLFVAIKGFESDGHRYIPKAMQMGAAAVLCEDAPEGNVPYIRIKDCRLGLALASREYFDRPAERMKVIGITGTSGKTTSSYLIKHMLERELGAKVGLIGTNGNMIGSRLLHTEHTTPESYELHRLFKEMADEGCSHVVMEVSSHSLTLERVAGINFDCAVYTNLSQDHLDFHKTMDEYAAAKRKIFSMCTAGCINIDDGWAEFMLDGAQCSVLTLSAENKSAGLYAENVTLTASGVDFTAVYGSEKAGVKLPIPGHFSVNNALGAMAAGLSLGLSLSRCADAMNTAHGVKGRLETVPTDGDYTVIIDYSHKPDALENVLSTLRPITKGRLMVLFGCGGDRDRLKRPVMGKIACDMADIVIVTSDNPRTEEPEAIIDEIMAGVDNTEAQVIRICDRIEAIHCAIDKAGSGDVILLAGKGHEDYQIIGHEKHHMDEREIVAEYLKKRI